MYMRELLEFLFDQIGSERVFVSAPEILDGLKNDFVDLHEVENPKVISNSIIDNFRVLFFQNGMERHYAFSTLVGNTANIITTEHIIDMKVFFDNGIALLVPDPIDVQDKGFTKESFDAYINKIYQWKSQKKIEKRAEILNKFRKVVGYYIFVNEKDEADFVDLTNKVYTLYKGTEREQSYSFVRNILKDDNTDRFLCSSFVEKDTQDHFWYINADGEYLGSVNERVAAYFKTWDFKILPGTFDLFLIQIDGKSHLYSYENDLVYNTFDLEFEIINVLNPNVEDYHTRTLLLLHNHDIDRTGEEDILAFTPLAYKKPEEKGNYVTLPPEHYKSLKQIRGSDVLYLIVNNPDYVKPETEEEAAEFNYSDNQPYLITLMYMDENDEFAIKTLPANSIPSSIYMSKKNGVITMTFRQDTIYNVVSFFHEYGTLYKYSYAEISTSGVQDKMQRKLTGKSLWKLKQHLIDTSLTERSIEEEYNQFHNFIKTKIMESQAYDSPNQNSPVIVSSYFVDMTNGVPNFDIERLFINNVGRFMDYKFIDGTMKTRVRRELSKEKVESILEEMKKEGEWLKENKDKSANTLSINKL